jgi:YggT family protein
MITTMSPLIQAGLFLTDTIFTFLMLAVLLRILLEIIRADFYNPICQMVLKLSNFLVIPVRRVIPGYYGIDWASIVVLLALAFIKQAVFIFIQTQTWAHGMGLMLLGIADILELLFYIYMFATLVLVASSWLGSNALRHPMTQIAIQLTAPILNRLQSLLPRVAGMDLAPMLLVILLVLFNILIISFITHYALILIHP